MCLCYIVSLCVHHFKVLHLILLKAVAVHVLYIKTVYDKYVHIDGCLYADSGIIITMKKNVSEH